MSVITGPMDPGESGEGEMALMHFVYAPLLASVCFYCGEGFTTYPVIHWVGHPGDRVAACSVIFLHQDCARDLAIHLASDHLEAKRATKAARSTKAAPP